MNRLVQKWKRAVRYYERAAERKAKAAAPKGGES